MVIGKRQLILAASIAAVIISVLAVLLVGCCNSIAASTQSKAMPTIVIDAGHGGEDGGAVAGDGTNEKDINLSISKKLNQFFIAGGFKTKMIRTDDTSIYDEGMQTIKQKKTSDMHNRLKLFNEENSVVLSIHQNKFEQEKYSGTQVFYSPNNENSEKLAENIRLSVTGMLQPENNRENKKATKDIYLLYNCQNPAVIVECGFISNSEELEKLKTEEYQSEMAFSIYCGYLEYLNTKDTLQAT